MAADATATDPQWAARLATPFSRRLDDETGSTTSSIRYAQVTSSTNQRNYLLGLVAEENGDIDFDRMLRAPVAGSLRLADDSELLHDLEIG